jgi:hypothetical protein
MKSSTPSLNNVILRLGSFGSTSAITYARIGTSICKICPFGNEIYFSLQMSNNSYLCSNISVDKCFKFAQVIAAKRYAQFMRTLIYIITFCLTSTLISSQTFKNPDTKNVWTFHNYELEWTNEVVDENCFIDTIYSIQFFPQKNDWKIYFDEHKIKVATLLHFDTLQKTINTKHFNRQGKLIKELQAYYFDKKNYNPTFIKLKNIIYLKTFLHDSLIYELQGANTSLFIKYKNFITKRHFESRTYYADSERMNEEIGKAFIDYYENNKIKTYCTSYIKNENLEDGSVISYRISDCKEFDRNGCIIQEK